MSSGLGASIEILKDKLVWTVYSEDFSLKNLPKSLNTIPFVIDKSIVYTAFFADFGPFDLGLIYKFCQQLHDTMLRAKEARKTVVFYTSDRAHTRSNSAVLLCAYMIFVLNATVEQAYGPFIGMTPQFIPFRDAGFCINTFPINVLDCARAMKRAKSLGHFSFKTFSLPVFQNLAKLQNGDISWIIPGKFIAFSGPITKRRQVSPGVFTLTPEEYVPVMKGLGVTCIVRFNSKCYDRNVFIQNGIRHVDLFYEDGGNPSDAILQAFLQICEHEKGAIAVHCKAGLGRTGTNIAAYMMKHYGYTTKESIAWCRMCRPGSVVGPQQQYLATIEPRMIIEGNLYRERHGKPPLIGASAPPVASTETRRQGPSSGSMDGRVMTPPLFNNVRDNKLAQQPQQTESLFHRNPANKVLNNNNTSSSNGNNTNSGNSNNNDDLFSKSANNLKAYSAQVVNQTRTNGGVAALSQQVQGISLNSPQDNYNQQHPVRPSTSSGTTSKKMDTSSSSFSPIASRQNLQSASPVTSSSRGYDTGSTSTPTKSSSYFGNTPTGTGAFQTPPPRQQHSSHYFTELPAGNQPQQQSQQRSASPDGKLIIALTPTSKRPTTSHQPVSSSSPMSTSKLYSSQTNGTASPTGAGGSRRSVSVNRSVNLTREPHINNNAGDLDYRYGSGSPSQGSSIGKPLAFASSPTNGKSVDYERQPKPSSPSLQYQQQQQYSSSPNATTSHMRLVSASSSRVRGAGSPSQETVGGSSYVSGGSSRPRTSGGGGASRKEKG